MGNFLGYSFFVCSGLLFVFLWHVVLSKVSAAPAVLIISSLKNRRLSDQIERRKVYSRQMVYGPLIMLNAIHAIQSISMSIRNMSVCNDIPMLRSSIRLDLIFFPIDNNQVLHFII